MTRRETEEVLRPFRTLIFVIEVVGVLVAMIFFVLAFALSPNGDFHESFATISRVRLHDFNMCLISGLLLSGGVAVIDIFRPRAAGVNQ